MSATEIVARAAALHVRLWSDGERVGMEGPATSIATIKPQVAANKSVVLAYLLEQAQAVDAVPPDMTTGAQIPADCIGALAAPDGGLFLPWGPNLSADDVLRLRAELAASIDSLAKLEGWSGELRDSIMSRAMGGPLADLLPNRHHFRERLAAARDEAAARAALDARAWKYDPARRGP